MNDIYSAPVKSSKLVTQIASVIGLTILGDSLMYSLLPLEGANLGFSLSQIGWLLSINRIIRLFSNTFAGIIMERFGAKTPFFLAVIFSVFITALYGAGWGFIVFLFARSGWGFSWSIFRQGIFNGIWVSDQAIKGKLMGLSWGIIRVGSAFSVLVGGFLYDKFGFSSTVWIITTISLFSIPLTLNIKWPETIIKQNKIDPKQLFGGIRSAFKTKQRRGILLIGFTDTLFEGVLVSTLSLFLNSRLLEANISLPIGIGGLAGILLALRYISNIIFAPLLGSLSDKFGQSNSMLTLSTLILFSLIFMAYLPGINGIFFLPLIFIAGSGMYAIANASSSGTANQTQSSNLFISVFTTGVDLGAALGPILVFNLGAFINYEAIYIIMASLLWFGCINFRFSKKVAI